VNQNPPFSLKILPGRYAICRFPPSHGGILLPNRSSFFSLTLTEDELSLVIDEAQTPDNCIAERGWAAIQVIGPLDFNLTGILVSLAAPLAKANISIFAVSTYNTDTILLREADLPKAVEILQGGGFHFSH